MSSIITGTVMVLGPFAVPVLLLFLFYRLNIPGNITSSQVVGIFIAGGSVSALIAIKLNEWLFIEGSSLYTIAIIVSITEEIVKALVIAFIIKQMKNCRHILNGLLIGATVGAGFSILESIIYAYRAYMWFGGFETMLDTIIRRNVLAPGNHIAWASVTGAIIILVLYKNKKIYVLLFPLCIIMHALWNMTAHSALHALLTFTVWLIILILIDEGKEEMNTIKEKKIPETDRFNEAMPDGRLTVPSDGKTYRLREAIKYSEELGRPLTEEEMQRYEKSLKNTPGPILPSELPKVNCTLKELIASKKREERRKSVERAMAIMTTSTNGPDKRFMEALELYVDGKITLEEMEVKVDGLEYLGE